MKKSAPDITVNSERITAMGCVNTRGEEKLKLLMVGKSIKPCCFKNVQTRECNELQIFFLIVLETNLSLMLESFARRKIKIKFLLITDNAPTQYPLKVLKKIDQMFEVKFFL
uniref:DDE-1 domain-containing protein n=1 Tax=Homalodisca liturata TaxID=320908 RepID=A0A1B6HEM7_9HEMI